MRRTCLLLLLAVCVLSTFGETLSCDQCGRECMQQCGTRKFRACCFNNMKKRDPDLGVRVWVAPPRQSRHLHLVYDA